MAAPTPIPVGDHEVTCTQVFTGSSLRGVPQLVLVLKDSEGRTAKRYLSLLRKDMVRTNADLAILGWQGDLRDRKVMEEFLAKRPIVGQHAMAKIEPYGEEGKTGVAVIWRVGNAGPWIAEANAISDAMAKADEAEAAQGEDDTQAQEQHA